MKRILLIILLILLAFQSVSHASQQLLSEDEFFQIYSEIECYKKTHFKHSHGDIEKASQQIAIIMGLSGFTWDQFKNSKTFHSKHPKYTEKHFIITKEKTEKCIENFYKNDPNANSFYGVPIYPNAFIDSVFDSSNMKISTLFSESLDSYNKIVDFYTVKSEMQYEIISQNDSNISIFYIENGTQNIVTLQNESNKVSILINSINE